MIFVFVVCLKQFVLGTIKFCGPLPRMFPVATALTASRVNQFQLIGNVGFVKRLTSLFKGGLRLSFAVIEWSFQQEKLTKGVAHSF